MNEQGDYNSAEYWDVVYSSEGEDTWRLYPRTIECVKAMLHMHGFPYGAKIADLGGGTGELAAALTDDGYDAWCVDQSLEALSVADERHGCNVMPMKADDFFKDKSHEWDAITMCEFIEHFKDPEELVKRAMDVTDVVVVAVPNDTLKPGDHKEHLSSFTKESLAALLDKHGSSTVIEIVDEWEHNDRIYRVPVLIGMVRRIK